LSARSERIDDDVEGLVVVAVVLDVPLEERRGVALARRLLTSWRACGRRDSAGQARAVSAGPGAGLKPVASGQRPSSAEG
jgi:hypothetical protein